MKIVLPGGSGQIGSHLARAFTADGHEVVVLSRKPAAAPWRVVPWDAKTAGPWVNEFDAADVVVNLAGKSVNCRYTPAARREILASRVESTRAVAEAIRSVPRPPRVWLQASTATIYAHRFDAANDEATGTLGGPDDGTPDTWRFSTGVAKAWEAAAMEADLPHTRRVFLRAAMTMTPDRGGVFDVLLGLVRKRLGGRQGSGRQFVSWVHGDDFTRALLWLIERGRTVRAGEPRRPEPAAERPTSCVTSGPRPGCGSACRRRGGCSKSALSSCGPRRN